MKKDNFWKIFWSLIGVFVLSILIMISWLKFLYINAPEDMNLALAVGITFDPTKDPFQQNKKNHKFELSSGYLYQDSIPFGLDDWSWDTETIWRIKDEGDNGSYVIKANFFKPDAGLRLNGPEFDISKNKSISLEFKTSENIEDLYIDFYDKYGTSMGKQSIKWYTNNTLTPNIWSKVKIPLKNLINNNETKITGFSITSKNAGIVFIDSIKLENDDIAYAKWVNVEAETSSNDWIGNNPFKNTEQINLPFVAIFNDNEINKWKELFGLFELKEDGVIIGPVPKKTTGSMTIFGGGQNWKNYKADSVVYWGITSSLSLLARFQNDSNFVSCAYSNYGMIVQIYLVNDGESNLVSQTPALSIKSYEPWKNVKHSIEVMDDEVSCYMDGEKVLKAQLPNMPKNGTFGFETWSKNSNDYPHKIISLSIKPI